MGTRRHLSAIGLHDGQSQPPASLPGATFYRTTAQSIPDSTDTLVAYPTTEWNNGITVSGGNTVFTLSAGLWIVVASVRFWVNSAGVERYVTITSTPVAGATRFSHSSERPGTDFRSLCTTAHINVVTTRDIGVCVYQDAGTSLNLDPVWSATRLQIAYLGTTT